MSSTSEYRHTQHGPWFVILYPLSVLFILLAIFLQDFPPRYVFLPVGILLSILATGVQYLMIEDGGDHLWIHFGPLPLFQLRIRYSDILSVQAGRSNFLDGWGIHWSLRGGWIWNIWGWNCVVIRLRKRVFFLGTNDAECLLKLLNKKVAEFGDSGNLIVRSVKT